MTNSKTLTIFRTILIIAAVSFLAFGYLNRNKAQVLLEWSTETEFNTVGFNVYRSLTSDGEFEKINSELIPSSPDPLIGGDYQFRDENTMPNQEYYYFLEEITTTGSGDRHGPIDVIARGNSLFAFISGFGLVIFFLLSFVPFNRKAK